MTTPEAGRVEEIQARHEKDRAENPLFFHPAYADDVYRDRSTLLEAYDTQAETIRRLQGDCGKWADDYAEALKEILKLKQRAEAAEGLARALARFAVALRFDHSLPVIQEAVDAGLVERITPLGFPTEFRLTALGAQTKAAAQEPLT